jgi:hypothetical protein
VGLVFAQFPGLSDYTLVFVYCIPSHYGIIVLDDGIFSADIWFPAPLPQIPATQRAATLGYVQGMTPFRGSVDDVSYHTHSAHAQ